MTRLITDPGTFAADALAGFVAAHRRWVRGVAGAVGAARQALERQAGLHQALLEAGEAWSEQAGGNALVSERSPGLRDVSAAVDTALAAIEALGGAQTGDKTLVDALHPFALRLRGGITGGEALDQAWRAAAADAGAAAAAVPAAGE